MKYLIYKILNFLRRQYFILGLNTFLVLIFVVFVADGPHFDRMFKMVLILAIHVLFGHFL